MKISTPSVASLLVDPVSGGQSACAVFSVVTDSPPETGGVPRRGEGVDKLSALSCRNEVCDPSSASVKHIEINSALFA